MIGLSAIHDRPLDPPRCHRCGYPEIYRLSVCESCYDAAVEAKIDEQRERARPEGRRSYDKTATDR